MSTQTAPVVVRRRLLHWRPRWRGAQPDAAGTPDVDGGGGGGGASAFDLLDDLFAAVLIVLAAIVFVVAVVPAVLLVLEVLLVVALATLGLCGRVAFRRPWTVEAVVDGTDRVVGSWRVLGWRRAGRARDQLAATIAFGGPLPPDGPYDPDAATA